MKNFFHAKLADFDSLGLGGFGCRTQAKPHHFESHPHATQNDESHVFYATIRLTFNAGIAQLVERNLAKVEVESSRLFSRSSTFLVY